MSCNPPAFLSII
uniref:Uncharacterized protein n=1 Tax=Anguilla anguilla TaxID=7936 RepID=A0A0E9XJ51_ANGAN